MRLFLSLSLRGFLGGLVFMSSCQTSQPDGNLATDNKNTSIQNPASKPSSQLALSERPVQPSPKFPPPRPIKNFDQLISDYFRQFVESSPLQSCQNLERFLKLQVPEYTLSEEHKQKLVEMKSQACDLYKHIQKVETLPQYTFSQLEKLKMPQLREVADSLKHFAPSAFPSVADTAANLLLEKIRSSQNLRELVALQKMKKIRAVGSMWVYETAYQQKKVAQILQERIAELQIAGTQKE